MALRRSSLSIGLMVGAPNVYAPKGARCLTCMRTVDFEGVVEGYPGQTTYCRYLVRCHGAEELRTFDMGSINWDWPDVRSWRDRAHWFDPGSFDAAPLGTRGHSHNDYDDPPPKPMVIGGLDKPSS